MFNALGILLVAATAVSAFFVEWFGVFGVAAAVCFLAAGLLASIAEDCGYSDTVCAPQSRVVHAPAVGYSVIQGGRDPLHRGPEAYPLTRRPVWDTDVFGAPE
ncbi:MAG: hypothetical protein U5N53_28375 [Mycobacterium sp.]|nr:hypothetical protein [Mycobacterium sp.]